MRRGGHWQLRFQLMWTCYVDSNLRLLALLGSLSISAYIYIYLYSMHLHLFAGWWIESTPSLKMAFQYKPSPCQSKLKAPDSRSSLQQPLMKLQKLESGSQINSTVKLPYLKWEFWSPKNYAFCFRKRGSDAWMTTWAALRFHWH